MRTRHYRSRSALYQRRRNLVLVLLATTLMALLLAAGFYLGQNAAFSGTGMDPESYRALQAELAETRGVLQTRQTDLEVQRTRHEVDRQALELVRRDMIDQEQQIAELEESLRFYRGLMSPGDTAQGLSLREIELVRARRVGHYSYRIVVQQEARKHQLLKGALHGTVFGTVAGEAVEYSLAGLSPEAVEGGFPLQFRYFQTLEGEIVLPKGFEPTGVAVVATIRKPSKMEAREEFSWQVQERFSHVGK